MSRRGFRKLPRNKRNLKKKTKPKLIVTEKKFMFPENYMIPKGSGIRLSKVAKMLDEGIQTIAEYLVENGVQIETRPNTLITNEHIEILKGSRKYGGFMECVDYTPRLIEALNFDYSVIFQITPEQFENLICNLLEKAKYNVQKNGVINRKDGGIDIIAWKKDLVNTIIAVQIKHKRNTDKKVSSGEVRDLKGAISTNSFFTSGMLVTNTDFTEDAMFYQNLIESHLELKNSEDIQHWLLGKFKSRNFRKEIINLAKDVNIDITI